MFFPTRPAPGRSSPHSPPPRSLAESASRSLRVDGDGRGRGGAHHPRCAARLRRPRVTWRPTRGSRANELSWAGVHQLDWLMLLLVFLPLLGLPL